MRHLSVALLAIALIAAPSFAQCSTLTVTGSVNAGQTVSIDLSGATANAVAVLAAGDTAGTTTFTFPGASVTIDLAQPFILFPLGMTDAAGHASLSVEVPANLPPNVIQDATYILQAVTASFTMGTPPSFSFCVSNTATLVSGAG